jgi:hypothetical protein
VAGHNGGYSHRLHNGKDRAADRTVEVPKLPKLENGWLDLDRAEARRLQLWGQRIIDDIKDWRHRERRRREGRREVSA